MRQSNRLLKSSRIYVFRKGLFVQFHLLFIHFFAAVKIPSNIGFYLYFYLKDKKITLKTNNLINHFYNPWLTKTFKIPMIRSIRKP
ncbi:MULTISPECIES: hypothetical protein [Acinetobacter]|jgi:hypothetical protein|uniref:Uncharacterized protein n=1 Tax=Acinetobacter lwoffii TaxID=28090 RepID=A0A646MNG9_ACILW|nr:hypothetical protein [Acinetobacter lwoffii]MCO8086000.1 hypothetical protein [Acinetobacter lwoffii]MRA04056.1 hypothetical protein [Acinetobacter lwoffii]QKU20043.1 hypothetical protein FOB19_00420 [Acinetobacter lwoffii]